MSLLLLLGLFAFIALSVYLGYLAYGVVKKKDRHEHEVHGAGEAREGPH